MNTIVLGLCFMHDHNDLSSFFVSEFNMPTTSNSHVADLKQKLADAYTTIRSQSPWSHPKSPELLHHRVLPYATYSPWLFDADFQMVYERIKGHTLVDIYRCYELWSLGLQMSVIHGNFLEVGVWRGGTGALLASSVQGNPNKHVYLADTFTGVVKAGADDTAYVGGEHADTSPKIVADLLHDLGLSNFSLLQGIFPEQTAEKFHGKLALLHCDVDVYSSAKDVVQWGIPLLSQGGAIVFDDYGFSGCEGVTRLVEELRKDPSFLFIHNLNGHAILIKK
jgi:O-methyltransferase